MMGTAGSSQGGSTTPVPKDEVAIHAPQNTTEERLADGDGSVLDHSVHVLVQQVHALAVQKCGGIAGVAKRAAEIFQEDLTPKDREELAPNVDLVAFFSALMSPQLGSHDMILALRNHHRLRRDSVGSGSGKGDSVGSSTMLRVANVDAATVTALLQEGRSIFPSPTRCKAAEECITKACAAVGLKEVWSPPVEAAFVTAFESVTNTCRSVYEDEAGKVKPDPTHRRKSEAGAHVGFKAE